MCELRFYDIVICFCKHVLVYLAYPPWVVFQSHQTDGDMELYCSAVDVWCIVVLWCY